MARFLITVWPLAGHYFPNLAVANALKNLGHEVAFYSGEGAERTIRGEGFEFFPFRKVERAWFESIFGTPTQNTPGTTSYRIEQRNRYCEFMAGRLPQQVEDVNEALDSWSPDVLVCDPLMWGPYIVLRESKRIKTAIFVYVPFSLIPSSEVAPLGLGLPPPRDLRGRVQCLLGRPILHGMTAGIRRTANQVRKAYGLQPLSETVTSYAGKMDLYLIAGSPELDYNRKVSSPNVHYVGPCLWSKPNPQPPAAWITELSPDKPVVHVTEGTIHVNAPVVLNAAARGLAGMNMHVVMATGTHRRPEEMGLGQLAPNVRVESWISYEHLLPRTDLVVTTAGAGTVLAALAHGIPMIVIPTEWDKPEVARRAAHAGAALFLNPPECTPQRLRQAVETVLHEPSYRENARRLSSTFSRYGGPQQAADLLSRLALNGGGRDVSLKS